MLWGVTVVYAITILTCCNAIRVGIAVFKTTVRYVQANMIVFLLPAGVSVLSLVWFVVWLFSAVFIFSVGEPGPKPDFPFITEVQWD